MRATRAYRQNRRQGGQLFEWPGIDFCLRIDGNLVCRLSTIGEAWVRAWYFEKCCRLQLDCLQTGAAIHMPPTTAMEKAKPLYNDIFKAGRYEWPAIMRKWRKATGS